MSLGGSNSHNCELASSHLFLDIAIFRYSYSRGRSRRPVPSFTGTCADSPHTYLKQVSPTLELHPGSPTSPSLPGWFEGPPTKASPSAHAAPILLLELWPGGVHQSISSKYWQVPPCHKVDKDSTIDLSVRWAQFLQCTSSTPRSGPTVR